MNKQKIFIALLALAVPVVALLPLPDFWIAQLNYIGLYALVCLGLVLLTGVGGLTSFGQAAFVGVGAYTTAYLTLNTDMSPWLTLFVGLGLTAISALVVGAITLRMSGHYLPLATIAWGLSLERPTMIKYRIENIRDLAKVLRLIADCVFYTTIGWYFSKKITTCTYNLY
jgi:branched-chain amino acid transport system permease protein